MAKFPGSRRDHPLLGALWRHQVCQIDLLGDLAVVRSLLREQIGRKV